MLYILLIDRENSMEFWVYDCAVIYQQILGGDIYAVPAYTAVVEWLEKSALVLRKKILRCASPNNLADPHLL